MKLFNLSQKYAFTKFKQLQATVVTIGNFDGLHLGHQAMLKQLQSQANSLKIPSVLLTFEPYPKEFFAPSHAPARLTTLTEKISLLKSSGVDFLARLAFNKSLSQLSPQAFIEEILMQHLKAKLIIVGDDFHFGHKRQGNVATLKKFAARYDYQLQQLDSIKQHQLRVSSSQVRELLKQGDFAKVSQLLGRDYSICGRVYHGDKRGRQLGFATANLALKRLVPPLWGVYAVTVEGVADKPWPAVANVGKRPTVAGERMLLEVHLFDWHKEIYGQRIKVNFHKQIRAEKKFTSLEELTTQIKKDVLQAKSYLNYDKA
ncbi:MAG: bifunctional riboflavin kinase/FAD synthetase [Pseudomonadota bacterium]